jgi:hypothetical protein
MINYTYVATLHALLMLSVGGSAYRCEKLLHTRLTNEHLEKCMWIATTDNYVIYLFT